MEKQAASLQGAAALCRAGSGEASAAGNGRHLPVALWLLSLLLLQRIATIRGCRECADLLDGTQTSLKHQHFKSDVLLLGEMLSGA